LYYYGVYSIKMVADFSGFGNFRKPRNWYARASETSTASRLYLILLYRNSAKTRPAKPHSCSTV